MADTYSLKALLSAVDNISPALKNIAVAARGARKYLGDVGTSAANAGAKLGIPVGVLAGLGAGFGAMAIKKAVVDFAALGEEVQKGALKAGMSNGQYQQMKYVFDQAGVSSDVLQGSMGKLNKNIGNAASGKGKDLESLLKTLGIPLRDVNGQVRSAADMLPELSNAFVKNKDPVKQAAMGTALFGKAFGEMLPLLNEGGEGLEKNLQRFSRLKGVISDDDLKGAKAFGDQLKDLDIVTKGFQMTIAKELVPVLGPLIEDFIMWAAANKKLIAVEVKSMVKGLVEAIKQIDWRALIESVRSFGSGLASLVESVGGAKNALIGLFVLMNIQGILAIGGLVASTGRLALATAGLVAPALAATVQFGLLNASMGVTGGISAAAALTTNLTMLAKSAGLLGAAALVGYAIGTAIYSFLLEDTRIADWIGSIPTRIAAMFGSADAQKTLAQNAAVESMLGGQKPTLDSAAVIARNSAGASAPGTLGSGSFNINSAAQAPQMVKVAVDFTNAPPGMQVTTPAAGGPRVAATTNVGYRTLGAGGSW